MSGEKKISRGMRIQYQSLIINKIYPLGKVKESSIDLYQPIRGLEARGKLVYHEIGGHER